MTGTIRIDAREDGVGVHVSLADVGMNDKANLLRAFLQGIKLDYTDAVVAIAAIMAHDQKGEDDESD